MRWLLYAVLPLVGLVELAACAFLGLGPNAGPQPPAPQGDLVPEWQGGGAEPVFGVRRVLDAGTVAADRAALDVQAADMLPGATCAIEGGAIHCEWPAEGSDR